MPYRLATEYHSMELDVSNKQLQELITLFQNNDIYFEICVLENNDQELLLVDDQGQEIPLLFRNMGGFFKCEGSVTFKNWHMAHTMQHAIRKFKGQALVHRIYETYIVEYMYHHGQVTHIIEHKDEQHKLIYKQNNLAVQLECIFQDHILEDQIAAIHQQIDKLLDKRLQLNSEAIPQVDDELKKLSKELFILEA